MTVAELIVFLQTQPQDIQVAYGIWSGQAVLRKEQINVISASSPRHDGFIQNAPPYAPEQQYLLFQRD